MRTPSFKTIKATIKPSCKLREVNFRHVVFHFASSLQIPLDLELSPNALRRGGEDE